MEAPVKLTPIFRKFWVPKPFREKMTQRILNNLDLFLNELNHQKTRGTFSFPDFLFFILLPIWLCMIVAEIVLIAFYFSNDNNTQACTDIYNNCMNPTSGLTSPGSDTCNSLYQNCISDSAPSEGVYIALIVLGAIGAAYTVFLVVGYLVARRISKKEMVRVLGVCYQYKPIIEATDINPKYTITLRFKLDGCCFANAFKATLVIQQKGVVSKEEGISDFEDLTVTRSNPKGEITEYVELENEENMANEDKEMEISRSVESEIVHPEFSGELQMDNVPFRSFSGKNSSSND